MAKNNQNGYVSWRVFALTVSVLVVIIGGIITLSIAQSNRLSDVPCRSEVLDADRQLKLEFERRDAEIKTDFLRVINQVNDRQERLESKIDNLIDRIGGPISRP